MIKSGTARLQHENTTTGANGFLHLHPNYEPLAPHLIQLVAGLVLVTDGTFKRQLKPGAIPACVPCCLQHKGKHLLVERGVGQCQPPTACTAPGRGRGKVVTRQQQKCIKALISPKAKHMTMRSYLMRKFPVPSPKYDRRYVVCVQLSLLNRVKRLSQNKASTKLKQLLHCAMLPLTTIFPKQCLP